MQPDLVARARESLPFAGGDVSITLSPRGARGQVWRLTAGPDVFALKHVFEGAPPARGEVGIEIAFARRAAAAGVCLPASHADRHGEYVVPLPSGGWLRLYDWLELHRADLVAAAEALGILLARLHRCAPPADREPDGAPPDRWYVAPPPKDQWGPLIARAAEADVSWAARLAVAADRLPALHSMVASTDPDRMCTSLLTRRPLHAIWSGPSSRSMNPYATC